MQVGAWRLLLTLSAGAFAIGAVAPGMATAQPNQCADDGTRAELVAGSPDNEVRLGRDDSGSRTWEIVFNWTGECVLSEKDITAELRVLQSTDASITGVEAKTAVRNREQRIIVTLEFDRQKFPPGSWRGVVEVSGPGVAGVGIATVNVRQQEPITRRNMSGHEQIVWVAIGVAVLLVLLLFWWLASSVTGDLVIAPMIVVGVVTLYPILAHVRGNEVPALWWPVWLGAAGLVGGFLIAALKHRSGGASLQGGVRFGAALILSFGAGVAAWRSQYVNTPDWALNLESALGLIGVVGAATVTAGLLFLNPQSSAEASSSPPPDDERVERDGEPPPPPPWPQPVRSSAGGGP